MRREAYKGNVPPQTQREHFYLDRSLNGSLSKLDLSLLSFIHSQDHDFPQVRKIEGSEAGRQRKIREHQRD